MRLHDLVLAIAVVAAPVAARATPNFPAAMARDLQLSAPPACTVCHATNAGGTGTVVKPFGKYLLSRGLAPFDEGSLAGALAAAGGERHDTDGDGILDVDALKQELDPNGSSAPTTGLEDPTFGCASTRGGEPTTTLLLALVVLLRLAAGHLSRRRGLERVGESTPGALTSTHEGTASRPGG
ncbi:MAG: hypothetical protein EHM78_11680 [Myxococcaceae bacterium]|nr:MAG: hypothetical protein EHM78_11680 [Myxococcaceae bacterium]